MTYQIRDEELLNEFLRRSENIYKSKSHKYSCYIKNHMSRVKLDQNNCEPVSISQSDCQSCGFSLKQSKDIKILCKSQIEQLINKRIKGWKAMKYYTKTSNKAHTYALVKCSECTRNSCIPLVKASCRKVSVTETSENVGLVNTSKQPDVKNRTTPASNYKNTQTKNDKNSLMSFLSSLD